MSQVVLDGVTFAKKVNAYNHAIVNYATENNASGNGGLLIKNSKINLSCDNPFLIWARAPLSLLIPRLSYSALSPP